MYVSYMDKDRHTPLASSYIIGRTSATQFEMPQNLGFFLHGGAGFAAIAGKYRQDFNHEFKRICHANLVIGHVYHCTKWVAMCSV